MTHQPSTNHHAPSFWGVTRWPPMNMIHHLSPSIPIYSWNLLNLVNYTNLAIENRIQIPCWMLNFHQPNQDSSLSFPYSVPVFLVNHGFTYGSTYIFPSPWPMPSVSGHDTPVQPRQWRWPAADASRPAAPCAAACAAAAGPSYRRRGGPRSDGDPDGTWWDPGWPGEFWGL